MFKSTVKNCLVLQLGIVFSFAFAVNTAQADVKLLPDWDNPVAPVYKYNIDKGIFAIPATDAGGYETTFATIDGTDVGNFLIEGLDATNNTINTYQHILNDPNAILGYAWSKRVGWLAFSHGMFKSGGVDYYPRFARDADGNQDILKGYIWSKYSGWVQLSSDNFEKDNGQDNTNWGVVFDSLNNKFEGRAWGAALGWIDFSNVTYDSATGKIRGYACSANDCSDENNKIYFDSVPSTYTVPPNPAAGEMGAWGVSKNMTSINDTYDGGSCELLTGTGTSVASCIGSVPTTYLTVNSTGTGITVNFVNRLEQKGNHDLKIKLTNKFGQTYEYNNLAATPFPDAKTLRVKSVVWPLNCRLNSGVFVCDAPAVEANLIDNGAIADGVDTNILEVKLLDNAVNKNVINFADSNIAIVNLTLNFNDGVKSNQLAGTIPDAVSYKTSSLPLKASLGASLSLSDIDADANGVFNIDLTSLAPTNTNNMLELLNDVDVVITLDEDATPRTFTYDDLTYGASNTAISFAPALTANFDAFNLIENAPTEFEVELKNYSSSVSISEIDLNSIFEGMNTFLVADLKAKSSSSSFSDVYLDQLQLVSPSLSSYLINPKPTFSGTTQILSEPLLANSSQIITFNLTPRLILGSVIDTSSSVTFETEVAYKLNGASSHTYHDSLTRDLNSGLITNQIDIKGLASGDKIHDITSGQNINVSGNMSFNEISEEIRKNVAEITRNETAGTLNATITNWATGNQINNGKTLYYEDNNSDTVVDNLIISGDNTNCPPNLTPCFKIDDSQGSIIIIGGDVYIKSNIVYSGNDKGSFGLIVIKDNNGKGGNIYVDPAVTNIAGGYYAEGAMMSAQDSGSDGIQESEVFDGFTDKGALKNQLFIKGTLISRNTIGGSRQTIPEYPEGYSQSSCTTGSDAQKCAERFDLNYVRNFATSGSTVLNGGVRAVGTDGSETTSDSAFVIKYDPRIQTNIPPGFEMRADMNFEDIVL